MSILDIFWSLPDDLKRMILLNLHMKEYDKLCSSNNKRAVCDENDSFWNQLITKDYKIEKNIQDRIIRERSTEENPMTYASLWLQIPFFFTSSYLTYGILDRFIQYNIWNRQLLNLMMDKERFIEKYIDSRDKEGETALSYALNEYQYTNDDSLKDIIIKLIDAGADVNLYGKHIPLSQAVSSESIDLVKRLIEAGANLDEKNSYGHTALMISHNPEITEILLQAGALPNIQAPDGTTALMVANESSDLARKVDNVKVLLKYGADPTIRNGYGSTVIDEAESDEIRSILQEASRRRKLSK